MDKNKLLSVLISVVAGVAFGLIIVVCIKAYNHLPREYSVAYVSLESTSVVRYWNVRTTIGSPIVDYKVMAESIKKQYGHKEVVILSIYKNGIKWN